LNCNPTLLIVMVLWWWRWYF